MMDLEAAMALVRQIQKETDRTWSYYCRRIQDDTMFRQRFGIFGLLRADLPHAIRAVTDDGECFQVEYVTRECGDGGGMTEHPWLIPNAAYWKEIRGGALRGMGREDLF